MDHILYFPTHRELKELQGRHTLDVYSDFVLVDKHCWVSSSQETVESKNKKTNMFFPTDIQRGITKILGSCQWVAEFLSSRGRLQPFSDRFHNNATTKAGLYRACIFTTFQAAAGKCSMPALQYQKSCYSTNDNAEICAISGRRQRPSFLLEITLHKSSPVNWGGTK